MVRGLHRCSKDIPAFYPERSTTGPLFFLYAYARKSPFGSHRNNSRLRQDLMQYGYVDPQLKKNKQEYLLQVASVQKKRTQLQSRIKADTTFEGLKQIVFEPEERVKIQELKPDEKAGYQVIDSGCMQ